MRACFNLQVSLFQSEEGCGQRNHFQACIPKIVLVRKKIDLEKLEFVFMFVTMAWTVAAMMLFVHMKQRIHQPCSLTYWIGEEYAA